MRRLTGPGLFVCITALVSVAPVEPAQAVVYCKTVGVPKGCVARVAPVVRRTTVVAPVTGVRVGTPMNRGGPVNRRGRF